jgi:di/tricarboxylate transporter
MALPVVLLLAILGIALILFITEAVRPDLVAIMVMLSLGVTGLVSRDDIFSGFRSPAIILILSVFILTGALFETGFSTQIGRWLVRAAARSELRLVSVVMLVACGLSLFMNNVASAAVVMPAVMDVSRRMRISPSKLLMPMSMATQLGGMATLLTTSNIVAGAMLQNAGLRGFGLLDFLAVGGSAAAAGLLYIAFVGRRSLPDRCPREEIEAQQLLREDLAGIYRLPERLQAGQVAGGSKLIGKSLAESGIGDRFGLTVIAIERSGQTLLSPGAAEQIRRGDTLLMEGRTDRAAQLEPLGVRISPAVPWDKSLTSGRYKLIEVLVAPRSRAIGRTLKQIQFRLKYGFNVVALWQNDRTYRTDVGDLPLNGGEALLVYGPIYNLELLRSDPDWIVLHVGAPEPSRPGKRKIALPILAVTLLVAALNLWPIHLVLFFGALAMLLTGCLRMEEAYAAIDWRSIFLVGGMLPVGIALANTGAAAMLGDALTGVLGNSGPLTVVALFFLVSALLNQFLPGGSAVPALLVPIAIAAARLTGADPRAYALVIAVATGTSMLTPFAHPVNVLVMGPGGYRFRDYIRAGLPVVLITFLVVMATVSVFWNIG